LRLDRYCEVDGDGDGDGDVDDEDAVEEEEWGSVVVGAADGVEGDSIEAEEGDMSS
jgi:hypothetical protein